MKPYSIFLQRNGTYCLNKRRVYTHLTAYKLCTNNCYSQILLLNESYLHKSRAVLSADRIFIIGAPVWQLLSKYVTLGRTF